MKTITILLIAASIVGAGCTIQRTGFDTRSRFDKAPGQLVGAMGAAPCAAAVPDSETGEALFYGGGCACQQASVADPQWLQTLAENGSGGGKDRRETLKHTVFTLGAKAAQREYKAFITVPAAGGYGVSIGGTGQSANSADVPMASLQALSSFGAAMLQQLGPGFMDYLQQKAARPPDPAAPIVSIQPGHVGP